MYASDPSARRRQTRHMQTQMGSPTPEHVPDYLLGITKNQPAAKRLIVAVDFGTTYSAIAYVALGEGESGGLLDPSRIRTVQNYPDDETYGPLDVEMRSEVPTEVIYPLDRKFREKAGLALVGEEQHEDESSSQVEDLGGPDIGSSSRLAVFGQLINNNRESILTDEQPSFRWGYGAHELLGRSETHLNKGSIPLSRFKLLLDESEKTKSIRDGLGPNLEKLVKMKVIKRPLDVIVDFLTCLFRHAKSELAAEGYDDSYKIEMVLCVPAIWTEKACRDMQGAMAQAMIQAGFPGVDKECGCIDNLFIVSEPEAAASHVLSNERDISVSVSQSLSKWVVAQIWQPGLTVCAGVAGRHVRSFGRWYATLIYAPITATGLTQRRRRDC